MMERKPVTIDPLPEVERELVYYEALPPSRPVSRWEHMRHLLRDFGLPAGLLLAFLLGTILTLISFGSDPAALTEAELSLLAETERTPSSSPADAAVAARIDPAVAVSIETNPPAATVLVDYDSVGVTPLLQYPLAAGAHVLSIRKPDHASIDTVVFISSDEPLRLSFSLPVRPASAPDTPAEPGRPGISPPITSPPPAADIAKRQQEDIYTAPGQEEPARRTAENRTVAHAGTLWITSQPAGAHVWLGSRLIGTTPLTFPDVPAGRHAVKIDLEGHQPYSEEAAVRPGRTTLVFGHLKAPRANGTTPPASGKAPGTNGTVQVLVIPWGSIYIDGALHKRDTDQQYATQLPAGRHLITVAHPILGSREQVVHVDAESAQRIVIDLTWTEAGAAAQGAPAPAGSRGAPAKDAALLGQDGIYVLAEEAPQLIGGLEQLQQRVRRPEAAARAGLQGHVHLQFIVDENGRVQQPEVTRGLGMGCDEEALRVIRLARFEPGRVDGRPVKVRHALMIHFGAGE